jgi:phosphatidylserine decarboxylase
MPHRSLTLKLEEYRQARRIHGGLLPLGVAALGIHLARLKIPSRRLRLAVYRGIFLKKYPGLAEHEAELPLSEYPSLNALFTRGIKPEFRPVPTGTPQWLAPCDGTVQEIGRIERGKLLTLKGVEYSLRSLLPGIDPRPFEDGYFAVIFLSPADCHRVFSPHEGLLDEAIHVPGSRLLVHPPYQRAEYPVYTLNERMLFRLSTPLGACLLVMVAGWGVGNITLPFDPGFRPRSRKVERRSWLPPVPLRRGEWMATFELGSTVVLITEPAGGAVPLVAPNEKIKYGQPILTYPG